MGVMSELDAELQQCSPELQAYVRTLGRRPAPSARPAPDALAVCTECGEMAAGHVHRALEILARLREIGWQNDSMVRGAEMELRSALNDLIRSRP